MAEPCEEWTSNFPSTFQKLNTGPLHNTTYRSSFKFYFYFLCPSTLSNGFEFTLNGRQYIWIYYCILSTQWQPPLHSSSSKFELCRWRQLFVDLSDQSLDWGPQSLVVAVEGLILWAAKSNTQLAFRFWSTEYEQLCPRVMNIHKGHRALGIKILRALKFANGPNSLPNTSLIKINQYIGRAARTVGLKFWGPSLIFMATGLRANLISTTAYT